jgi:hypothetical protein
VSTNFTTSALNDQFQPTIRERELYNSARGLSTIETFMQRALLACLL